MSTLATLLSYDIIQICNILIILILILYINNLIESCYKNMQVNYSLSSRLDSVSQNQTLN